MPRRQRRHHRLQANINIVPYVDVLLVLLAILLAAAPLIVEGIDVNLPQANAAALDHPENQIIINMKGAHDFNVHVGSQKGKKPEFHDVSALAEHLKSIQKQSTNPPIYLAVSGDVRYDQLAEAMAALNRAGVQQLSLLTEPGAS